MALAYLLSPTFQIENSAGKPATGGYIEVYQAGSRNKYYCASDFDGTLLPFRIPLDSLGSNVILAEDSGAYDVYVYNRYGGELMSRYNVRPGAGGGGIGSLVSTDESIIITTTDTGATDIRTNTTPPSILRATAQDLSADGQFVFSEVERDGQNAVVDNSGRIIVNEGWWHYDAIARIRWPGNPEVNETQSISIYTRNNVSDSMTFDLSYAHSETVQVSGEYKATENGTQLVVGITGMAPGMTVELVDFGVHSIVGEGAGGKYEAGNGITIDEPNRIISIDPDVVQEKLTAGTGITIDENNVISATEAEIYTVEYTGSPIVEGTELFDDAYAAYQAGKTLVLNWVNSNRKGSCIGYYSAYGLMFSVEIVNLVGTQSDAATEGFTEYLWLYSYGTQSRWRSSTLNLLPRNFAEDAGKVLMVDPEHPTSTPIWQAIPAQQQADWAQSDSAAVDYIKNKPTVDQTYDSTSTNAQSGTAVAEALATIDTADFFVATYNVTTFADILAAYNAGKTIVCKYPVTDVDMYLFCENVGSYNQQIVRFTFSTAIGSTLDNIVSVTYASVSSSDGWSVHTTVLNQPVQSDWAQANSANLDYIKNKPANLVQDADYHHTDNNYTDADVAKLSGIEAGAQVNVQSDWTEANTSADSFIQHKPAMKELVAGSNISITEASNTVTIAASVPSVPVQDVQIDGTSVVNAQGIAEVPRQVNADWTSSAGASEILNKPNLATVATSGDYNDLSNLPSIQAPMSAGTNIDITNDTISVDMTASSTSANAREAISSVSQSADGSVSATARKVVGSEWTMCQVNSASSSKFLKIAEFNCYSGFRYVGSGYTDLVVKVSDADDARMYTVGVGIIQAANGSHNFSAAMRPKIDYLRGNATQPIKSFYLFSDKPYGDSQVSATLSLWVEFDTIEYNMWTFEAILNTVVGGTGSDAAENAWTFADGKRSLESALPTGGWQLNSGAPVPVNVPTVGSGDNGKVLTASYDTSTYTASYSWQTPASAPVTDVEVGGVSVVNAQGVAEVPSIPVIGTTTL